MNQDNVDDAKRHVDEEDRLPAESGDQDTSERGSQSRPYSGHRAQQPHGAAGL